jgi:post-segregation antitoxin (ccd killing protein)
MTRIILPNRRPAIRFECSFRNTGYSVGVGYDYDGRALEVFIDCHRVSSDLTALARDAAISISLALQHGCSFQTLAGAMSRDEVGNASGIAGAVIDEIMKRGLA